MTAELLDEEPHTSKRGWVLRSADERLDENVAQNQVLNPVTPTKIAVLTAVKAAGELCGFFETYLKP